MSNEKPNKNLSAVEGVVIAAIKELNGCKYFYKDTIMGAIAAVEHKKGINMSAEDKGLCFDKIVAAFKEI